MNRHLIGSLAVAAAVAAVLTPALRVASPVIAAVTVTVLVAFGVGHGLVIGRARRTGPAGSPDTAATTPDADISSDIRLLGVDLFLSRCRLVAGPVPDPGHPGGMPIALWQPPAGYDRVRVLEAFNGTPGADGRYERIAHVVSARHRDPLTAAAASYGVPVDVYAALTART
jgi:hypothetical protein